MEQRSQVRRKADLGAVVSCPQFGLFRGRIEDLSLQGIYVRTTNVVIGLNAPVTVTFQPEPSNPLHSCQADGVVVYQDQDGVGIRFTDLKDDCQQTLLALLEDLPVVRDGLLEPERLAV
jgi:hypothetical protein